MVWYTGVLVFAVGMNLMTLVTVFFLGIQYRIGGLKTQEWYKVPSF